MLAMLLPMLIIATFSFYQIVNESNTISKRNNDVILAQLDEEMEIFYTDIDNAYLILATDSDVSGLLSNMFTETDTSLNSIRFAEILAANFRNIIFTNNFVQNIYFYLNNDQQKVFTTMNKKITILDDEEYSHIEEALKHDANEDVWLVTYDTPPINIDKNNKTLQIYRRLYYRATRKQSGLIIYSLNLEKLENSIADQFNYDDQLLLLLDNNNNIIDVISHNSANEVSSFNYDKNTYDSDIMTIDGQKYSISTLSSERSYGLKYVLLTPINDIYRFAFTFLTITIIIFVCVILATAAIAFYRTKAEHAKVDKLLELLSNPAAVYDIDIHNSKSLDPFSYIQFNIMKLFLEQDYLKMQNMQKESQLQLSQLKALQHQINPHFLNNTLNIIYWKSIQLFKGENECSDMLLALSDVMRYSLSDPQENTSLHDEIEFIKKYISLMKKRFPNKINESYDIESECLDFPIKKMLLQPLVENSINHGLRNCPESGKLIISAHMQGNCALINIYDTGIGIPKDKLFEIQTSLKNVNKSNSLDISNDSAEHIGLINTHLRLLLQYGESSGLHIASVENEYTEISFSLPSH